MNGQKGVGRMWHLYKMGGITPALASMFGVQNAQQMAFIRSMSKSQRKEPIMDQPLAELETVVFDLETTGFYPYNGDAILSFGAIVMRGAELQSEQTFYRLVNPERIIPERIVQLTGITDEMAAGAGGIMETLHDFMAFVGTRPLIAHASGHDKQFLDAALRRNTRMGLNHRVLDTMQVAKWLEPNRHGYGLDELLEDNDIEITVRHHALEDSIMTAKLWRCYLEKIISRNIITLGDLYAYLSMR